LLGRCHEPHPYYFAGHAAGLQPFGWGQPGCPKFLALHGLGHEVHILRFHNLGRSRATFDFEQASETAQTFRQRAASWQEVELPENGPRSRVDWLRRIFLAPALHEFRSIPCLPTPPRLCGWTSLIFMG